MDIIPASGKEQQRDRLKTVDRNPFLSDTLFDKIYPSYIQDLSAKHWTPLSVTRKAAAFLVTGKNARVLDIGSGSGKFCLGAAHYQPSARYYGIEQRFNLVASAETAKLRLGISNVHFRHGNFTQLDFRDYDHFYFYNSFYENLIPADQIDQSIDYSDELYHYYNRYLFKQLDNCVPGTRLVTYHVAGEQIPSSFHLADEIDQQLKCWVKIE